MALTAAQLDRAQGVLLGTAAGDALGAGYEDVSCCYQQCGGLGDPGTVVRGQRNPPESGVTGLRRVVFAWSAGPGKFPGPVSPYGYPGGSR
jgi:hypothetical protein